MLNLTKHDDITVLRDGETELHVMSQAEAVALRDALNSHLGSTGMVERRDAPTEAIIGVNAPTHYEYTTGHYGKRADGSEPVAQAVSGELNQAVALASES